MNELTQIPDQIHHGDPQAAADLLPLVYAELRRLAAAQLAREKSGQTLDATALVQEAYLALVGPADESAGRAAAAFSPPPPKPYAVFSSTVLGERVARNARAAGSA